MSESDLSAPKVRFGPEWVWNQIRYLFRSIWSVFRESRLGLTGLIIVLAFALLAIFAPVLSPYARNFTAPDADRFAIATYPRPLPSGLDYNAPTLGPTTPTYDDKQGGLWVINSAKQGRIFMDFTRYTLGHNVSPFQAGALSYQLNLSDFAAAVSPDPLTPPLSAVYFVLPGANLTGTLGLGPIGDSVQNGAIAFFAGQEFVIASPYSKTVYFHERLPFAPTWTGEDPSSSGDMILAPSSRVGGSGLNVEFVAPYHYFYASDGNHTEVFMFQYTHEGDQGAIYNNQFKFAAPVGKRVLSFNGTLSAPPFVYYDANSKWVDPYDNWQSGRGQAVILPLTNNSMMVYNVTGKFRAWVPLTLDGQAASITGSIGFVRAPELAPVLFVPLRSAQAVGLGVLDLGPLTFRNTFALQEPTWDPVGVPNSYTGDSTFLGFYDPAASTTRFLGFTGAVTVVPQVNWTFEGRVQSFFEVAELSKVFIYRDSGRIYAMTTSFETNATAVPELNPVSPPSSRAILRYAGTPAGTLYGGGLSQQEMHAIWTDTDDSESTLFQLLGTSRTPLPPGTYPSGNAYWLGTDFKGEDILTQLFWGTQVAFLVGLLAALFTVGIGTLVGLIAGYYGGIIDTLLMRLTDIFLVLPFLPIVLVLDSILRPSVWTIILVIGIVSWPGIARVIRSQVLTLKERPFIDAARVSGASDSRLIFRHIAPNVLPFSFLYMSLTVSGAIITEAALSFLGLGDATVISWGGMLSQVLTFGGALSAWWWLLPPGLCITFLSLGFYLMGRGFDEIINPRLRRR